MTQNCNRQAITWLAAGALEPAEAEALGLLLLLLLGWAVGLRPTADEATQATDPTRVAASPTRPPISIPIPEVDSIDASEVGTSCVLVFRRALHRSEEEFDRLLDAGHGPSTGREPDSYRMGSVRSDTTL